MTRASLMPMTEPSAEHPSAPAATGIAAVDEVVEQLAGLAERPLEEHAAVLEQAHADLRATLDAPPATDH